MATFEILTKAATDVLAERRRQVEKEGWTPEHDDEHDSSEMAAAAAAYAIAGSLTDRRGLTEANTTYTSIFLIDRLWPWVWDWWKPKNRRRDLVKAGALILAEIERLDRLAEKRRSEKQPKEKHDA